MQNCSAGDQLEIRLTAPTCWNGKDTDSPNHRDHVAYLQLDGISGQWRCPSTHQVKIPGFTLASFWTVDGDVKNWRLASDDMPIPTISAIVSSIQPSRVGPNTR